jgi:hypothetical protein
VLPTPPTALDPDQPQLEETMHTIFTYPAREAHPDLDAAARHRADRLAKATTERIQAAPPIAGHGCESRRTET